MDDPEVLKWTAAGSITVICFFLKHLHSKLDCAASKADLKEINEEMAELHAKWSITVNKLDFDTTIRNLRTEHESDRRELRDNQVKLFDKLDILTQLLTQTATKVTMLVESRGNKDHG